MFFCQTKTGWLVSAPAKLNLFFEVYGKRADSFHEIISVALPVRLFDTLTFEPIMEPKIDFACQGGTADVPTGEENIVVRALRHLCQRTGVERGARVRLFKRIPSQAGLGGGSSDAAAVILAARQAWNLNLSNTDLTNIAAELGSDCPVFFHQNASISWGRGEKIRPLQSTPKLYFVILKPDEGLSTAQVYAQCMPCHDKCFQKPKELLNALKYGNIDRIGQNFFNRLEEPAKSIWSRFGEIRQKLEQLDCLSIRMSGSGTAFYGLCRNFQHACRAAGQLRKQMKKNELVFAVENETGTQ
jgi:4-diphosphocytidyl-2-C-methyl-D-erythritol kinase